MLAAIREGSLVLVEGPHRSLMAGLNCGLASQVALPDMARGIAAFCAIDDRAAESAVRMLYADGLSCGETGASAVAGLLALRERWPQDTWQRLGLPARPAALALDPRARPTRSPSHASPAPAEAVRAMPTLRRRRRAHQPAIVVMRHDERPHAYPLSRYQEAKSWKTERSCHRATIAWRRSNGSAGHATDSPSGMSSRQSSDHPPSITVPEVGTAASVTRVASSSNTCDLWSGST